MDNTASNCDEHVAKLQAENAMLQAEIVKFKQDISVYEKVLELFKHDKDELSDKEDFIQEITGTYGGDYNTSAKRLLALLKKLGDDDDDELQDLILVNKKSAVINCGQALVNGQHLSFDQLVQVNIDKAHVDRLGSRVEVGDEAMSLEEYCAAVQALKPNFETYYAKWSDAAWSCGCQECSNHRR